MEGMSTHCGLVHVVLLVGSVTSKGITVLVRNSPKLMTFLAGIYGKIADDERATLDKLRYQLVRTYSQRKLFVIGRYEVRQLSRGYSTYFYREELEYNTDLFSLWS